jgi:hypothetical protein
MVVCDGRGKYTFHDARRRRISDLLAGGFDMEFQAFLLLVAATHILPQ